MPIINLLKSPRGQIFPSPGLYGNLLTHEVPKEESIDKLVSRIMAPPRDLYSADGKIVTLTKTWVVGLIGKDRFEDSGPLLTTSFVTVTSFATMVSNMAYLKRS